MGVHRCRGQLCALICTIVHRGLEHLGACCLPGILEQILCRCQGTTKFLGSQKLYTKFQLDRGSTRPHVFQKSVVNILGAQPTDPILASLCYQGLQTGILVKRSGRLCFPKMAATTFPSHTLFLQCDFDTPPTKSWGLSSLPLSMGTPMTLCYFGHEDGKGDTVSAWLTWDIYSYHPATSL